MVGGGCVIAYGIPVFPLFTGRRCCLSYLVARYFRLKGATLRQLGVVASWHKASPCPLSFVGKAVLPQLFVWEALPPLVSYLPRVVSDCVTVYGIPVPPPFVRKAIRL